MIITFRNVYYPHRHQKRLTKCVNIIYYIYFVSLYFFLSPHPHHPHTYPSPLTVQAIPRARRIKLCYSGALAKNFELLPFTSYHSKKWPCSNQFVQSSVYALSVSHSPRHTTLTKFFDCARSVVNLAHLMLPPAQQQQFQFRHQTISH